MRFSRIHLFLLQGRLVLLKGLVKQDISLNFVDSSNPYYTPLIAASANGRDECVNVILQCPGVQVMNAEFRDKSDAPLLSQYTRIFLALSTVILVVVAAAAVLASTLVALSVRHLLVTYTICCVLQYGCEHHCSSSAQGVLRHLVAHVPSSITLCGAKPLEHCRNIRQRNSLASSTSK